MPDYTKNLSAGITGHTGPEYTPKVNTSRSNLDDMADVRDLLSAIVGAGKSGLKPEDQSAVYARLGVLLGKPTANKLINQALIFNQRPDAMGKTAEQRITQFYDTGSRDPELNTIISKTKSLGEGPVSGANQSVNDLTKKISKGEAVKGAVSQNQSATDQLDKLSGSLK
jgi:hypothetical protein